MNELLGNDGHPFYGTDFSELVALRSELGRKRENLRGKDREKTHQAWLKVHIEIRRRVEMIEKEIEKRQSNES